MKLVWHIVAKDLRRMQIPLLLWSVVLIAKNEIGVNLWLSDAADLAHFDLMKAIVGVLAGLDVFVNMVLVALLVHEDAVVGTRQFWTTRPISGGRLLAAKLLGAAGMFGVLPVVISLRLWWASDYGAAEMMRAALLVWDGQILVVGFALVVATLTENMNRFLLGVFGAAVGGYAWLGATVNFLRVRPETEGVERTMLALLGGLLIVTMGIVVVGQFRRRGPVRLRVMLVSLLLAALVVGWWRWDWTPAARETSVAGTEKIKATAAWAGVEPGYLYLGYRFTDLPKELSLRGEARSTWALSDEPFSWKRELEPLWPAWAEWQALGMPADHFHGPNHRGDWRPFRDESLRSQHADTEAEALVWIRGDSLTLKRLATEPAPFHADLTLELFHPVAQYEVVPRTGERNGHDGWHARIAHAEYHDGLLIVRLVESRSLWSAHGLWRAGASAFFRGLYQESERRENEQRAYFQLNRARGTVQLIGRRADGFEAMVPGQAIRWQTIALGSPAQMEGATLAALRYEPDGALHREVKLDHLAVLPLNP